MRHLPTGYPGKITLLRKSLRQLMYIMSYTTNIPLSHFHHITDARQR
jgi:hypothetical protein